MMTSLYPSRFARDFFANLTGASLTWTTGAKTGLGTAYYNPESGESQSNVWYTLAEGILTEVYYPDVSTPNLRSLELIVSDGQTFTDFERFDTVHETRLACKDALVYEQVNTAKSGKYKLTKTYVTHPNRHAVVARVRFHAIVGTIQDYHVFIHASSGMSNNAADDETQVIHRNGTQYLTAYDDRAALAISASVPFLQTGNGCSGELDLTSAAGKKQMEWTVVISFGSTIDAAIATAELAHIDAFDEIKSAYVDGWRSYVQSLYEPVVGSPEQYYAAAMMLKAHEDKLRPGAIVASMSIPWGDSISAQTPGVGGYHLVWSRDLYQIASALAVIGDTATAKRVLAYFDDVQQKPDGSFPQNSWLDGTPYWDALQMDQVAFPILLAFQLGELDRYHSLVKPAAEFIALHGPGTPQERWEENSGYSPSTLAAEIAALVIAGDMALQVGDTEASTRYFQTADKWALQVNDWTVTRTGQLSKSPYYIRVSDTQNPDDGHYIELTNGGGWRAKTEVVDAGFLELVRLGIKAADDPLVINSLNVVDEVIKYETAFGPTWRRYPYDGYGEQQDGSAYTGTGIGRPWPLLTGERGEYEIALQASSKVSQPTHIFGPAQLLHTMERLANDGLMIPEQIWDTDAISAKRLFRDCGTGAATPLAWGLAQYLRLAECIRQGRIVEMPSVVYQRYAGARSLLVDVENSGSVDDDCQIHVYPRSPIFVPGDFALKRVQMWIDRDSLYFDIRLGHLDNPWNGPSGISKQIIDIYIDADGRVDSGQRWTKDLNVKFQRDAAWEKLIRITGNWHRDAHIYNSDWSHAGEIEVWPIYETNTIHIRVNTDQICGVPHSGWGFMVVLAGEEFGRARAVRDEADEWSFGRSVRQAVKTSMVDFLVPAGHTRHSILCSDSHGVIELPMIRFL